MKQTCNKDSTFDHCFSLSKAMLHIIIHITKAQTIMQDTSQNSFFPWEIYTGETEAGTEMTIPLQREDNSKLCSFKCLRVLARKKQNKKKNNQKTTKQQLRERWKLEQQTVLILMRKDHQCKFSVGHISRTMKLNLLNVPKIKWQIKHNHQV